MSDINTLKTAAEEKYEKVKNVPLILSPEAIKKIENDFHQALSERAKEMHKTVWDNSISPFEKTAQKTLFENFYKNLTEEQKNAYTEYQKSIEQSQEEDKANTEALKWIIATPNFDIYKNLSSKELIHNNDYIKEIQKFILTLWAENTENRLTDSFLWWPKSLTRSRVRAIQTHLNTTYNISWEDLGCKNNTPDGLPGAQTLTALLSQTDDNKTIRQDMIDKKPQLTVDRSAPAQTWVWWSTTRWIETWANASAEAVKKAKEDIKNKELSLEAALWEWYTVTYNTETKTYTITDPNKNVGTLKVADIVIDKSTKKINVKETTEKIQRPSPSQTYIKDILPTLISEIQQEIKSKQPRTNLSQERNLKIKESNSLNTFILSSRWKDTELILIDNEYKEWPKKSMEELWYIIICSHPGKSLEKNIPQIDIKRNNNESVDDFVKRTIKLTNIIHNYIYRVEKNLKENSDWKFNGFIKKDQWDIVAKYGNRFFWDNTLQKDINTTYNLSENETNTVITYLNTIYDVSNKTSKKTQPQNNKSTPPANQNTADKNGQWSK